MQKNEQRLYSPESLKNKMEKEVILRAEGIRKEFQDCVVLDNVSLSIQKGEIFGIIGISGCGKTTLLHTFVGFNAPEQGEVFITHNGKEISISKNMILARRGIGFAPQHPSFYPRLTVEENLEHFGILYGLAENELDEQLHELLKVTKLEQAVDIRADHLSYGMQKRLGIACALIHKPSILLMDEPTADLDPLMRREIWKLVRRINDTGTTIVIASHLLGEVESMCTRIGMLHNKKFAYIGTFENMKQNYCPRQEITLKTESRLYDALIQRLGSNKELVVTATNEHLQVMTTHPEKTVDAVMRHVKEMDDKIEYLHVSPPSLEELFTLIEEEK